MEPNINASGKPTLQRYWGLAQAAYRAAAALQARDERAMRFSVVTAAGPRWRSPMARAVCAALEAWHAHP